jgi:hypothetical protein
VKNRFQNSPFKCNLQRYIVRYYYYIEHGIREDDTIAPPKVGRCRLNQVDPYPITYSLSNP